MISFYDLLTMIKNGNVPEKVKYSGDIYEWKNSGYVFEVEKHRIYLSNYFLEGKMFDETIEIVEENKIEKLDIGKQQVTIANDYSKNNIQCMVNEFYRKNNILIDKLNEIIDYLNERGNEDE